MASLAFRLGTAIHEAGHAVAFLRLFEGRVVDKVSIVPKDGVHGSHRAEELVIEGNSELTDEHQKSFEDEAVYACAGYAALIVAGRSEDKASAGYWQDFEEAASASNRPR